jgi:hypothetical protein
VSRCEYELYGLVLRERVCVERKWSYRSTREKSVNMGTMDNVIAKEKLLDGPSNFKA